MKVDGCGPASYYNHGYEAMGAALEASGRPIEYSCSWPAYINGGNETIQPFATFIEYGCNGWRNWNDIQCNWHSLGSIIDHWGDYGLSLQPFAGPGHWHDMDMLLIGNGCVTHDEEMTQMAIWAISASPLIMGE
jgi:alpha-N-acetylgalactosaminidase|eukprot:COSAG06_NODE_22627_length_717_cov_1.493528_2_plen_134_part_00